MSNGMAEILFIVVMILVVIGAGMSVRIDHKIDDNRRLDLLAELERETLLPMCRIKVTTERGHFYTSKVSPTILFEAVHSSRFIAEWRMKGYMDKGYFPIVEGEETFYIPACNVLSAQIIDYEPSV